MQRLDPAQISAKILQILRLAHFSPPNTIQCQITNFPKSPLLACTLSMYSHTPILMAYSLVHPRLLAVSNNPPAPHPQLPGVALPISAQLHNSDICARC